MIMIVLIPFLFSACASVGASKSGKSGTLIFPEATMKSVDWTAEDLKQPVAIKNLRTTTQASYMIVRLNESETPHVHENHDLVVVMWKGKGTLFISDSKHELKPGDIVEIPRGVRHWVEKPEKGICEAYVISVPPYDPKDMKIVE